ncbi:Lrp/AsnC family transcriptional regulator [Azospirillum sp. Marseille-Q6669]
MMDELDQHLLDALQDNAREPTAALARRLRVSRSTVQSRIQRLEERGVIAGYTVRLSDETTRRMIRAHVSINLSPKLTAAVVQALKRIPEVRALHAISGAHDLIAVVRTGTMEEMDALIDRIGAIDGIERTTSSIIMATKFER